MLENKFIYIIIPVFNNLKATIGCLESLANQTYKNWTVVLVDDGSSDGTSEYVKKNYPHVMIVNGSGNWWWSKSMNMGINAIIDKAALDDLILSLNNDLTVGPNYLEELVSVYKKNTPCVVGSVSVWSSDQQKLAFTGVKWNDFNAKYRPVIDKSIKYSVLKSQFDTLDTDILPGRGTLYSVGLLEKTGLYDDTHFPQYIGDIDFAIRAKKAGYKLLLGTKAVVYSDVENTGINFKHDKPSFGKFVESLYSMRSANNIKARYYFAVKHGRIAWLYFMFDFGRIFGSFLKNYMRSFFI